MIDLNLRVIAGIGLFLVVVCVLLLIFGRRDEDEPHQQSGQFPADYCIKEAEWVLFCHQCKLADTTDD